MESKFKTKLKTIAAFCKGMFFFLLGLIIWSYWRTVECIKAFKKRHADTTYPTYVWIRQVNERLYDLEQRVRSIDAGQGEKVIDCRAEFEALVSAYKSDLLARIGKIEQTISNK